MGIADIEWRHPLHCVLSVASGGLCWQLTLRESCVPHGMKCGINDKCGSGEAGSASLTVRNSASFCPCHSRLCHNSIIG